MELTRTDERDEYHRINGGTSSKFGAKKIVVVVVGVSALALVVVLIAVFSKGFTAKDDPLLDIPELEWEGDCPVEHECPDSFKGSPPPLLLVSLDGFRPDYLRRNLTLTLQKLAKCGVHAEYMSPVYPSKTFPNHYTQVTGLYPESHGIIDNSMYDPDTNKIFKLGNPATFDPEWWQREPIWVSAEKQGKRTATFFWPGSDVKVNGTRPTYYKKYSSQVPFESRVVQVLQWLDLPPPRRPAFLTLYFNEPDKQAHHHGTTSQEVDAALARVDRLVLALFSGLQARNLTGCVNVFIASDHGMADVSCDRVVDVRDYIEMSTADVYTGTFGRVRPKDNSTTTTEELESQLRCRSEHLRVFEKEHLPVRMHYRDNRRIEPIILDTDAGWTIFKEDYLPSHKWCTGGSHGYDHFFPDMRAFFTAVGPSMKKNVSVEPFLNIELYELMCELIEITPNPNNGTRGSLHHFLRQPLRPLAPRVAPVASSQVGRVAKDAAEYAKRVDEARCPCRPSTQADPETDSDMRRHLPFGVPTTKASDAEVRLLKNVDYEVGFDERRRMTMWATFTLGPKNKFDKVTSDVCWTGDARVNGASCPNNETLLKNDLVQWPLYPPPFSVGTFKDAAAYVTNSIVVSQNFSNLLGDGVWRRLLDTKNTPIMNIITGPAFATPTSMRKMDDNGLIVPSHLFVIATHCSSDDRQPIADCHPSKLRSTAYLIPSHPYTNNCEMAERVILRNRARVADIEGATGLEFFTGLPQYDAIRLRTALP